MEIKISQTEATIIQSTISKLPEIQQEVVQASIKCSEVQLKQRRYTMEWIYTCLLMRIKSKSMYDHIMEMQILPVPSRNTLNSYIQKLEPSYGFQPALFECLRLKGSRMEECEKHGI